MKTAIRAALLVSALVMLADANAAQSGWFIGGSVGQSQVEANIENPVLPEPPPSFDEDDTAWKLFGGYSWVLAKTFGLSVEGAYVNFGEPSGDLLGNPIAVEPTAFDLFGVASVDIGPIGIFGKVGYAWWDADVIFDGEVFSDDGNDVVYGIGARFNLWSLQFRAEYEIYDISDIEDLTMWSVGAAWTF
jgi:outer membrane immunogenic protein